MQLNRKGLWPSCNSYVHKPAPYKRHTLLLMKSQAIVVIKEKFSFQLKKKCGNEFGTQALWCSDSSAIMAAKATLLKWRWKGKGRRTLFLTDVCVKILPVYFFILTPSLPTQSWLLCIFLFNNTKSKNRERQKNVEHHHAQLERAIWTWKPRSWK